MHSAPDDAVVVSATPAGFWVRAVALLVDLVILLVVQASLGFAAARVLGSDAHDDITVRSLVSFHTLLFAAAYTSVLHALPGGQTIGKLLVGVHVVTTDGRQVPFGAALLRYVCSFVSAFPFGLGFVVAGLRHDKRALHDLLAGTRVERRRLVRAPVAPPSPPPAAPADVPVVASAETP